MDGSGCSLLALAANQQCFECSVTVIFILPKSAGDDGSNATEVSFVC